MRNYNSACSSLRPGQLDKLVNNLHVVGREMNEPDKTYFMIEPPSQSEGQADKLVLCVCNNNRCQHNDDSISGCELYGKHSVDLCSAFISETAAERIAALEDALKRIGDISWGYDGDCGAQAIVDSVIDEQRLP